MYVTLVACKLSLHRSYDQFNCVVVVLVVYCGSYCYKEAFVSVFVAAAAAVVVADVAAITKVLLANSCTCNRNTGL